jgi:hypothetical protein
MRVLLERLYAHNAIIFRDNPESAPMAGSNSRSGIGCHYRLQESYRISRIPYLTGTRQWKYINSIKANLPSKRRHPCASSGPTYRDLADAGNNRIF